MSAPHEALFPLAARLVLTQPDNPRAAKAEELKTSVTEKVDPQTVIIEPSAAAALRRAYELTPPEGLICVTGSLYLIGEIQAIISKTTDSEFANWKLGH